MVAPQRHRWRGQFLAATAALTWHAQLPPRQTLRRHVPKAYLACGHGEDRGPVEPLGSAAQPRCDPVDQSNPYGRNDEMRTPSTTPGEPRTVAQPGSAVGIYITSPQPDAMRTRRKQRKSVPCRDLKRDTLGQIEDASSGARNRDESIPALRCLTPRQDR